MDHERSARWNPLPLTRVGRRVGQELVLRPLQQPDPTRDDRTIRMLVVKLSGGIARASMAEQSLDRRRRCTGTLQAEAFRPALISCLP